MLARIRKAMAYLYFSDTPTADIYTLSLHDALPIFAIPVFLNQRKKGWDSQAKSDLRNAATGEGTCLSDNSSYIDAVGNVTAATVGFKQTGGVTFTDMAAYDSTGAKVAGPTTATPAP